VPSDLKYVPLSSNHRSLPQYSMAILIVPLALHEGRCGLGTFRRDVHRDDLLESIFGWGFHLGFESVR